MPRPIKRQINIKMPEPLIEELKAKAEEEDETFTDLIIRYCEQGLGGKGGSPKSPTAISTTQLDKRIASWLAPLQEKIVELEAALGETVA
jgi:hypothetical protein